ncbi:CotS family spore coat protein [Clostridium estertheticum]|uniref:CotS family spore coat protein n=1 Tax=Clostridium estertheticum TaxID=238834 RepID=UPI0009FF08B4|nr:CotS family spore coat protein [Clostridium estertheticum]MBU3184315.1 CotS family spore coat protein [Clostridium estertheticum]MBZ9617353.1 CotS family spore coat protein [Clostridium estertheticum subsp. laramiense]WAG73039.1 CotS family spore coat protein [Clostridium estertheticum]
MDNESNNYLSLGSKVLLSYDIKPLNLKMLQSKGLKTLWKLTYKNTPLCLKRLNQTMEEALFSVNAQIYIFNNGGMVPRVYPNAKGNFITEYNGQLFVLYSWVNGRDMNLENPKDLNLALQSLSKFHITSIGYVPPINSKTSSKLGNWPKQYTSMKNRMLKIKEICIQTPNNANYSSLVDHIDPIIEICDKTINLINSSSYSDLCSINQKESCLCHQDFGTGNVMLIDGKGIVIDLDSVTYDLPSRDLRKIIGKRMMQFNDYNINNIETILKFYEINNILSPKHREVLKIDLMFPHWFFGLIKNIHKSDKSISAQRICAISSFEQNKFSTLQKWL